MFKEKEIRGLENKMLDHLDDMYEIPLMVLKEKYDEKYTNKLSLIREEEFE